MHGETHIKMEDYPLSSVHSFLFDILAATFRTL